MDNTSKQFDEVTTACRQIFILKMKDYGPSWRIFRQKGIADQLYIKAKHIRQLEQTGVSLIGEDIRGDLQAIVNYGATAIIQSRRGFADEIDMSREEALKLYDETLAEAKDLMLRKNHDYGEAWREMSEEGITDMIFAKIVRIKSILENDGKTVVSEGVEGNYFDMINYAVFNLIKLTV